MGPARYGYWLSVCLLAVLAAGCDIMSLPYFLGCPEPSIPPLLQRIASKDKDQEVSALVLVTNGLELRTEMLQADRELSLLLTKHLKDACFNNKEKVKFISTTRLEQFKNDRPDWQQMDLVEIGRHFKTDWVIYLEIGEMSLHPKGSSNLINQGHADIRVSLVDVKHPDEAPQEKIFTGQFPSEVKGGAIDVDRGNERAFRLEFFNYIAEQITWYFTDHLTDGEHQCN